MVCPPMLFLSSLISCWKPKIKMGILKNIVTPLHTRTSRNYLERMVRDKVACMKVARQYGRDFWDGSRDYGYGGYRYDGRWETVARQLIAAYQLPPQASILDVGCGKGFLLYEFKKLLPECRVQGFDISEYALEQAHPAIKKHLFLHRAEDSYDFPSQAFDLVMSLGTLHNLRIDGLQRALQEMERVGKNKYLMVESYRDEQELFNLQCWALTCESFFRPEEWGWLFERFGYSGDYEFIYFN